ncbi:MAG: prepilin-type N-terminal cleavage/methylation domain-containing protein [Clostridiales bacterium]|nr:prepilin-type N-terminal cleavage/methylation domain-containing protein [Clostridiales bacterium]
MKPYNKGFTLIELIIAISISVVVLASLASLLWQSTNYYRRSNEEISLQMEAQTILNQLKDLIVEADNVEFDMTSDPQLLRIQQGLDKLYEISLNSDNTLSFVRASKEADDSVSRTESQLFGMYVLDFHVIEPSPDYNAVKISFTLQGEYSTYRVEESVINIRNQIKPMQSYW